jgi:probable F420-dependent oxidoreductase
MRIGVIFPQTEIGADPGAIREFVQGVEGLGFDHLVVYDHVLGADHRARPGWKGFYNYTHMFHEPLVLFGYLAGITKRIELVTGVLVLSQRQTALVAKQVAEADVLTGGRVRLGVGIGWNEVEFEALDEDFHNRGARLEEQIAVLRALWTQELITFDGRWHKVTAAGLNPLPVQRPIPIWIGSRAEKALQRTARIADGWMPPAFLPGTEQGRAELERFRQYVRDAGRDPAKVGIEGRVRLDRATPEQCAAQTGQWRAAGVSHVSINTMDAGFKTVDDYLRALRRYKEALAK